VREVTDAIVEEQRNLFQPVGGAAHPLNTNTDTPLPPDEPDARKSARRAPSSTNFPQAPGP